MSTNTHTHANTTDETETDTTLTVADLRAGDRIAIEGRPTPFVVEAVGEHTVATRDGETLTKHGAKIAVEQQNANTFVIADVVNPLVGEHTGEIKFRGANPSGVTGAVTVRRVGGDEE